MNALRRFVILFWVLFLCSAGAASADFKTVIIPLTIDYPLLKSLVIQRAFTGPGHSAVVMDEGDGCNFIRISDPVFSESGGLLRCETRVLIRTGAPFRDTCLMPAEWNGYVAFLVRPLMDRRNGTLSFHTVDSAVYTEEHRLQQVTDWVWELIKTRIYAYIDAIEVDLEPPVLEIKSVLGSFFPGGLSKHVHSMLSSLRFGEIRITPQAVQIELLAEVEEVYDIESETESAFLSDAELDTLVDAWETWDAFLVHLILSLTGKPLGEEERRTLFETLLEARYRFTTELAERTVDKDLVREEFIEAWTRLSPIFRNHFGGESSEFTLGYLAFFTAADALATLDRIGPTLGIAVSREGLIRMARLIRPGIPVSLEYDLEFNPELREILDLGAPLPMDVPADSDPTDVPEDLLKEGAATSSPWIRMFVGIRRLFSGSRVWAKTLKEIPNPSQLERWLPPNGPPDAYIRKVERLLSHAATALLKKGSLHRVYHDFYKRLVLATAWQESCFRQFVKEKGKITYLLSYNRTSVGLMQVNRRVWRGIYEMDLLMWNIHYNAAAGCEILDQYFRRYALPKLKAMQRRDLLTEETAGGVVYAMYNVGTNQFSKYPQRKKEKAYFLSDTLFMEKFRWTTQGLVSRVEACLQ